jgi:hypothetical protein
VGGGTRRRRKTLRAADKMWGGKGCKGWMRCKAEARRGGIGGGRSANDAGSVDGSTAGLNPASKSFSRASFRSNAIVTGNSPSPLHKSSAESAHANACCSNLGFLFSSSSLRYILRRLCPARTPALQRADSKETRSSSTCMHNSCDS